MTTTLCTGCGDYQSADPSGHCWECRTAEPGYRAQLDARVIDGMTREYEAHPDWKVRQPRTVALDRGIGDAVVYANCPGCGWAVPVGFERNDPGAATRPPRPCGPCQQAGVQARAAETPEHRQAVYEARSGTPAGHAADAAVHEAGAIVSGGYSIPGLASPGEPEAEL